MTKEYYVYFLTNWTDDVLYIGMTNDMNRRLYEHQHKLVKGFSSQYNLDKLVYVETCSSVEDAIAREKQLKGWTRVKKNGLVARVNSEWKDLSEGIV